METKSIEELVEPLHGYFTEKLGSPAKVTDARRLAEGNSRLMLIASVQAGDDTQRYVLRVEQGGIFGTSSAEEYRIMDGLYQAGFPVARVRWLEESSDLLGEPFFVMDYIDGDFEYPTGDTVAEFVKVMDRLHQLDWQAAELDFDLKPQSIEESTHMQIDRWANVYRDASNVSWPLLEEAAAWLHLNAPTEGKLCIVHGDPGPGNLIHDNGKILALTDFEFTHLGHPHEDYVFCASMRGMHTMSVEEWLDLYREVLGTELTENEWHYWRTFNLFKGACANVTSLRAFCENNPAVNLAMVGTAIQQNCMKDLTEMLTY